MPLKLKKVLWGPSDCSMMELVLNSTVAEDEGQVSVLNVSANCGFTFSCITYRVFGKCCPQEAKHSSHRVVEGWQLLGGHSFGNVPGKFSTPIVGPEEVGPPHGP